MSDFWSGIFLVGIIVLAILLLLIALLLMLLGGKNQRLNIISFGIVVTLLSVWIIDRFIVGAFCLPSECTKQEVDVETLLLNAADLPENWSIRDTYNYAYVPRASSSYIERIFHKDSKLLDGGFIQEIYQYRSVRGASFQYDALADEKLFNSLRGLDTKVRDNILLLGNGLREP